MIGIYRTRREKLRAGGKKRFVAYEVAVHGMIPIVATLIVYGLEMAWTGRADFNSIPYGETAIAVCCFALWGYFRAEHDWTAHKEKNRTEADNSSPNSAT